MLPFAHQLMQVISAHPERKLNVDFPRVLSLTSRIEVQSLSSLSRAVSIIKAQVPTLTKTMRKLKILLVHSLAQYSVYVEHS